MVLLYVGRKVTRLGGRGRLASRTRCRRIDRPLCKLHEARCTRFAPGPHVRKRRVSAEGGRLPYTPLIATGTVARSLVHHAVLDTCSAQNSGFLVPTIPQNAGRWSHCVPTNIRWSHCAWIGVCFSLPGTSRFTRQRRRSDAWQVAVGGGRNPHHDQGIGCRYVSRW